MSRPMTARQFAKSKGFEVVGKLTRKTYIDTWTLEKQVKRVYWIDEAGNEYHGSKGKWCIVTADGGVI